MENKLNLDLSYGLKGSYTVEGAIIIPIFITMLAIAMNMGLVLYNEMKQDSSYEYATDMSAVHIYRAVPQDKKMPRGNFQRHKHL